MKPIFTPPFRWEQMLEELARLSVITDQSYRMSLGACNQSFRFIQVTLDRLEVSSTTASVCRETLNKIMTDSAHPQNDFHPLAPEHEQVYDLYMKTLEEIRLDYENFFLHARILMDRLSYLTRFLFPRDNLPYRSFNRHREYLLNAPGVPNHLKGYSEYITKSTGWFALLLRTTRDSLIVHSRPFTMTAMISGRNDLPRPIKINWESSVVDRFLPLVNDIRAHYSESKTLQSENNFWNIIETLSNMQLTHPDEVELAKVIASVGTTMPRLDVICSGIIAYLKTLLKAASLNRSTTSLSNRNEI